MYLIPLKACFCVVTCCGEMMKMWTVRRSFLTCRMMLMSGFPSGCGRIERIVGLVVDTEMKAPCS
jgi:hypothetical protein